MHVSSFRLGLGEFLQLDLHLGERRGLPENIPEESKTITVSAFFEQLEIDLLLPPFIEFCLGIAGFGVARFTRIAGASTCCARRRRGKAVTTLPPAARWKAALFCGIGDVIAPKWVAAKDIFEKH